MKQISIIRTVILSLVLITSSMTANGQLTKGSWLLGGWGSFNSSKYTFVGTFNDSEYNAINVGLSPSIGFFLADKFAVGLKPSFSWDKVIATAPGSINTSVVKFDFGPYARYYFLDKIKSFNILADVSYQYGIYHSKFQDGVSWRKLKKGSTNIFSIMAGTVVYFNSSVGLEFVLGYNSIIEDIEGSKRTMKGLQMGVGLQIHLRKE